MSSLQWCDSSWRGRCTVDTISSLFSRRMRTSGVAWSSQVLDGSFTGFHCKISSVSDWEILVLFLPGTLNALFGSALPNPRKSGEMGNLRLYARALGKTQYFGSFLRGTGIPQCPLTLFEYCWDVHCSWCYVGWFRCSSHSFGGFPLQSWKVFFFCSISCTCSIRTRITRKAWQHESWIHQ